MADQLYLSLWFPNFRLEGLPAALTGVLRQFATVSGDDRVRAASAYPLDFTESPTYQRIFVNDDRAADSSDTTAAHIEHAVAEATEQLHQDMAYEFEVAWNLWLPDPVRAEDQRKDPPQLLQEAGEQDDSAESFDEPVPRRPALPLPFKSKAHLPSSAPAQATWKLRPSIVRILGFGPDFDTAGYTQNGHIRVDFGLDTNWTIDEALQTGSGTELEPVHSDAAAATARHIQQNVELLLAFALLVEKQCNLSSRLLWTESGEPLAEKLISSLQRLH